MVPAARRFARRSSDSFFWARIRAVRRATSARSAALSTWWSGPRPPRAVRAADPSAGACSGCTQVAPRSPAGGRAAAVWVGRADPTTTRVAVTSAFATRPAPDISGTFRGVRNPPDPPIVPTAEAFQHWPRRAPWYRFGGRPSGQNPLPFGGAPPKQGVSRGIVGTRRVLVPT